MQATRLPQLSAQRHISDHVAGSRILKTTSGSCRAEFQKGACYTENDGPFEPWLFWAPHAQAGTPQVWEKNDRGAVSWTVPIAHTGQGLTSRSGPSFVIIWSVQRGQHLHVRAELSLKWSFFTKPEQSFKGISWSTNTCLLESSTVLFKR